jgi:hypothetical protein
MTSEGTARVMHEDLRQEIQGTKRLIFLHVGLFIPKTCSPLHATHK